MGLITLVNWRTSKEDPQKKPCSKCGVNKRAKNQSWCTECVKKRDQETKAKKLLENTISYEII